MKRHLQRIAVVAVFTLVASAGVPLALERDPAFAQTPPVLGGQLFSTGAPVEVEVLPASAALTSQLWLLEPQEVFIATNRDVGTVVQVGPFDAGVELLFGIRVGGNEFRMGPAERNPDNVIHAQVEFIDEFTAIVGFEDLFGGGDRDYDDNVFEFRGGIAPEPPDPEPEPDPVTVARAPIADAGPDQTVPEGSVVTLDASDSEDPNPVILEPSSATANLPGGTSIGAGLNGLSVTATGELTLVGTADVGEGDAVPDTALAYILDTSGSVNAASGCGVGDQNGDGRNDRILDCEIAAAKAVNAVAIDSGIVAQVAAIVFAGAGNQGDVGPEPGLQILTGPGTDNGGQPIPDVEETLMSAFVNGGYNVFSRRSAGAGTNYQAGLVATCTALGNAPQPSRVGLFLSDGENLLGSDISTAIPCADPVTFFTFAVGGGASCASDPRGRGSLQEIADLTGGTCTEVPDIADLPDILPSAVQAELIRLELSIDGEAPVDITALADPALPLTGPAGTTFMFELPPLTPGAHEVCLTAFGSDVGGDGSVTTCSTVTDADAPLQYSWELIDGDGPPITLSSATAEQPSFLVADDATYLFELTVTNGFGLTDTDRLTVTVENVAPLLTLETSEATAGSLTLVAASFTDPGWLDTHSGSVDWGDGTTSPLTVTTGSGWGTAFGSHVFAEAGTYSITLTLTDDDGGTSSVAAATFEVAEPVAIWGNRSEGSGLDRVIEWTGGNSVVNGRVHSNAGIKEGGAASTFIGGFEYVTTITDVGADDVFDPAPAQVGVEPLPVSFDLADYQPGGRAALAAGDRYFDLSAVCAAEGRWDINPTGTEVATGLYYVPCDVKITGSSLVASFTVVAEGTIQVSGSDQTLAQPFIDGLLLMTTASGDKVLKVSGARAAFSGFVYAPNGEIELAGADNRFFCGTVGDTIDVSGSDLSITGGGCARPDATTAATLLVPQLALELAASRATVAPTEAIDYDLALRNDGSLLIVTGLVGAENVDEVDRAVAGYTLAIDYFSVADGAWIELATATPVGTTGGLVLRTAQNTAAGVTYPPTGDPYVGTLLAPESFASWSYEAAVPLSSALVELLLDPSAVDGIRVRTELDFGDPAARVRQLFRFGNDFIDALRALSGDVTAAEVSLALPVGDPLLLDQASDPGLALIEPGQSVPLPQTVTVPEIPARGEGESDAAYVERLLAADGLGLFAAAFARATGGVGLLIAPQVFAGSTQQVPVVEVSVAGPVAAIAGEQLDYDLTIASRGSVDALSVLLADAVDGTPVTTGPIPATLVPGQIATTTSAYIVPADQPAGPVTNRAEATWSDAVGNVYGPSGDNAITEIAAPPELTATLTDTLAVDNDGNGLVTAGDVVEYVAVVGNGGGTPVTGVRFEAAPDPNTAIVPGSVTTSAGIVAAEDPVTVEIGTLNPGASAQVTFRVSIPDPADFASISVQGIVTSNELAAVLTDDPVPPGPVDPTVTTVFVPTPLIEADLLASVVIERTGDSFPSPTDTVRYTAIIDNLGGAAATGALFMAAPDENTTLVAGSVTTTSGTVILGQDPADDFVEVDIGTIPIGGRVTVTFDVTVDDPFPAGVSTISVQGWIATNELDPVLTDDPITGGEADPTILGLSFPDGPPGGPGGGLPSPEFGDVTPADGAVVTEPVTIDVVLTPPDGEVVDSWSVTYRRADSDVAVEFATGSGPNVSAVLDPTVLPNGLYFVTITATASGGGVSFVENSLVVEGNLKPGRYVTTFQDLAVAIAGLPLEVLRSYDSFDKTRGDFGIGWTLDVASFRVSSNGPLGEGGWRQEVIGGGLIFAPLGYFTDDPHYVTVTWPDGRTETFDLTPANGSTFFPGLTSAEFTARPGSTSELEAVDSSLFFTGDGNLYGGLFGSGGIYDPQRFRLTDTSGTEYLIDVEDGLVQARDRAGNTLTVSENGLFHSLGESIAFDRDPLGRITRITGPDGGFLTYTYDAAGNLASSTDPNGNVTTYSYLPGSYLDTITDPLGRPFRTLEYDAAGRITAVIDGEGNRTEIATDVGARQEVVTSATGGLTTISTYDERGNLIRLDEIYDGNTATSTFAYDANDNRTSRTDPLGNTTTATYDAKRNLTQLTDALGNSFSIAYDANNRLVSWTDQEGNVTSYDWNPDGTLDRIVDALGNAETYTYDAAGNRLTSTDRVGNTYSWTYDAAGRRIGETDPNGHTTTFAYDAQGRIASVTDPLGGTITLAYDAVGNLVSQTDPLGNTTTQTFDPFGNLLTRTDALGNTTTRGYDAAQRLVAATDPLGATTTFTYDADGRLLSRTSADGGTWVLAYDGAGQLLTSTDPLGRVTTRTYDLAGRQLTSTNPAGGTTTFAYDGLYRLVATTDPLGNTTTRTFSPRTNLLAVTDALGRVTSYSYDAAGRRTAMTMADGVTALFAYDDAGRLTATTDPAGATTTFSYDGVGNRTSVTDPLGNTWASAFDALNRVVASTDPLGNTATNTYDAAGRLVATGSAAGVVTSYTYDAVGRRTSVTDPLGNATASAYDAAGRLVAQTDARGNVLSFGYDARGRPVSITDPLGNSVQFSWDLAGQPTSLTDANGGTWTSTFDVLGNLTSMTDPLGNTGALGYDVAGNLVSETDARGVTVTYGYDAAGQLISVSAPGETVSRTYDAVGRMAQMTDATGATSWSYDPVGRLTQVTAPQGTVSYAYDAAGRRTSLTQPEGTVGYTYDAAGQVATVTDWNGDQVSFGYDADGNLTGISRDNGVVSTYSYDAAGRLTRIDHDGPGGTIDFFDYGLDADGNRISMASAAGTESYGINSVNQLTQVTYPGGATTSYTYDAAGNRLSETTGATTVGYTYDAAGRITSRGGVAYANDAAGNLVAAGADTYAWDWAGRLASATIGGATTDYAYDGDGVRVGMTTGGAATDYVWDRAGDLELLLSDGTSGYLHANDLLIAQVAAATEYPIADALGSVRALTGSAGTAVGTATYEVFGATRSQTGASSIFGFTGQQGDPNSLLYLRARYLDPEIGRFLAVDPARPGAPGVTGFNEYAYAGNNPTTWTDPSGAVAITAESFLLRLIAALVLAGRLAGPYLLALAIAGIFLLLANALLEQVRDDTGTGEDTNTGEDTGEDPGEDPDPPPPCRPIIICIPPPVEDDEPRVGELVYRVWGGGSPLYSPYWSPEDPEDFGPDLYRVVAGLPDQRNSGEFLAIGRLADTEEVVRQQSAPMSPPLSWCEYPGRGIIEYVIPAPEVQVVLVDGYVPLDPPYGGRPEICPDGSIP